MTNLRHKGISTYGLNDNKTGVSALKVHEVEHSKETDSREALIFLTFSTFDSEWVLLENEN